MIFDRLNAADVSWRIYVQNYEPALTINTAATKQRLGGQLARVPLLSLQRYLDDPALLGHIVDLDQYYRDLESAHLPAGVLHRQHVGDRKLAARPAQGSAADALGAERVARQLCMAELGPARAMGQLRRLVRPRPPPVIAGNAHRLARTGDS